MKIAVVGLGAVGGLLAARLALAGHEVSALTRGETLAQVRRHGLRLRHGDREREESVSIAVSDRAEHLGPQTLVLIAVKAHALAAAAGDLQALRNSGTLLVPAMNGVPWWFLQAASRGGAAPVRLRSIDPLGLIETALPLRQTLGCVVHLSCSSPEPGCVQHAQGDRLLIGEPAGGVSERAVAVCDVLRTAGFQAQASADIRRDIWYKLWGNMTMNPVSALTGATSDRILDDPLVQGFMLRTMAEAAAIGALIGCPIEQSGPQRLLLARELGAFRTSMLQDLQAGRALEIDALVSVVHEIGLQLGLPTPNIDALLGLTRLMARQRGLYPD